MKHRHKAFCIFTLPKDNNSPLKNEDHTKGSELWNLIRTPNKQGCLSADNIDFKRCVIILIGKGQNMRRQLLNNDTEVKEV